MLQVTLPVELGEWVTENAAREGFDSPDALVFEALRQLRERQKLQRAREAELLLEALKSGEPIRTDDAWWDELQNECLRRIETREKNGSA